MSNLSVKIQISRILPVQIVPSIFEAFNGPTALRFGDPSRGWLTAVTMAVNRFGSLRLQFFHQALSKINK